MDQELDDILDLLLINEPSINQEITYPYESVPMGYAGEYIGSLQPNLSILPVDFYSNQPSTLSHPYYLDSPLMYESSSVTSSESGDSRVVSYKDMIALSASHINNSEHKPSRKSSKQSQSLKTKKIYPVQSISSNMMAMNSDDTSTSASSTNKKKPAKTDHLFKSRYRHLDPNYIEHKPTSIPLSIVPSKERIKVLSSFMDKYIRFFNLADSNSMTKLITSSMNDNTRVRIHTPSVNFDRIGSNMVVSVLTAMANVYPDGVIRLCYVKSYRDANGTRRIKAKLRFSGTKIDNSIVPGIANDEVLSPGQQYMVADSIDDNISSYVKNEVRRREHEIKQGDRQHLPKTEYEIKLNLYIDDFTDKIALYDLSSRLVAFDGSFLQDIL